MADICQMRHILFEGFEALELFNTAIHLILVPELGGKIVSLIHRPSQREWLWRNPHMAWRAPVYGSSFIDTGDTGGLDECFPTVAPATCPAAPWQGTPLPDHGELWCQPWETTVIEATPQRIVLAAHCDGVRLPYRFQRTITLEAGKADVEFAYQVANRSAFPMPFVWSLHPLLNIQPGMKLILPEHATQVRVDMSVADYFGKKGTMHDWPLLMGADGQSVDLSTVPPPDYGRGVKLYAHLPCEHNSVEARIQDGPRSLRLIFRPDEVTHTGLWLNYRAWSPPGMPAPYYNLGLEPCIGGSDSLETAYDLDQYGLIAPQAERRWSLTLRLT